MCKREDVNLEEIKEYEKQGITLFDFIGGPLNDTVAYLPSKADQWTTPKQRTKDSCYWYPYEKIGNKFYWINNHELTTEEFHKVYYEDMLENWIVKIENY